MGSRKNHAKLLRIWLSGQYQSLPQMVKGLKDTEDAVSLKLLRTMSAKNGWIRKRAENAPKLEAMISAKVLAKDSTRIAKIRSGLIELEELLLEKIKSGLKNKKTKFTTEEALKGVRSIAELHARVVEPRTGRVLDSHEAPTGESPAAGALSAAQASVVVNFNNQGQPVPQNEDFSDQRVTDADLEDAIRAGQGIVIDEKPKPAKTLKPARKKGHKA